MRLNLYEPYTLDDAFFGNTHIVETNDVESSIAQLYK